MNYVNSVCKKNNSFATVILLHSFSVKFLCHFHWIAFSGNAKTVEACSNVGLIIVIETESLKSYREFKIAQWHSTLQTNIQPLHVCMCVCVAMVTSLLSSGAPSGYSMALETTGDELWQLNLHTHTNTHQPLQFPVSQFPGFGENHLHSSCELLSDRQMSLTTTGEVQSGWADLFYYVPATFLFRSVRIHWCRKENFPSTIYATSEFAILCCFWMLRRPWKSSQWLMY